MSETADVIELGSSDEEPEPATKKPKRLNAMVSIPNNKQLRRQAPRGSIHVQQSDFQKVCVAPSVQTLIKNPFANKQVMTPKRSIKAKPGTLVNMPIHVNQPLNIHGNNSKGIIKNSIVGKNLQMVKNMPKVITKNIVNPGNLVTATDMARAKHMLRNLQNPKPRPIQPLIQIKMGANMTMHSATSSKSFNQIQDTRSISGKNILSKSSAGRHPTSKNIPSTSITEKSPAISKNFAVKSPSGPPQLPPGITVTRVTGQPKKRKTKRPPSPAQVTFKKQKLNSVSIAEVPTVELDDDDDDKPTTTASPKWYVRPEEVKKVLESKSQTVHESVGLETDNMEKDSELVALHSTTPDADTSPQVENNKEPGEGKRNMIEITIDDSPIKPPPGTQTKMVSDLSIIVEDSPKKLEEAIDNIKEKCSDIKRTPDKRNKVKSPHSRKKLNYPQSTPEFFEVEVDFLNPIELPLETDVPITNIINLDTPTKPATELLDPNTTKNKPPTMIKGKPCLTATAAETNKNILTSGVKSTVNELENSNFTKRASTETSKEAGIKQSVDTNKTDREGISAVEAVPSIQAVQIKAVEPTTVVTQALESTTEKITKEAESIKFEETTVIQCTTVESPQVLTSAPLNATTVRSVPIESATEGQCKLVKHAKVAEIMAKEPTIIINTEELDPIEVIKTKKIATENESESVVGILKDKSGPTCKDKNNDIEPVKSVHATSTSKEKIQCTGEFNQTYQQFIDVCFEIENSEDMKKIVEKKVKEYYRQVDKRFTESQDFIDIVSAKIMAMKLNPENLYLYIKDIVDELKIRRKQSKGKIENDIVNEPQIEGSHSDGAVESDEGEGSNRNIRRLEKAVRKLHRAIQKLEEEEVDFDDDNDSVYLLTESKDGNSSQAKDKPLESDRQIQIQRYKARFVRVHAKLLQLTGTRMPSEARVRIETRPGRPGGPALRLERWVNRKMPAGAPLPFPDFHDVVRCVREANTEDRLGWSELEVMEEARDLFSRCGKKLQRRRQANEWQLASSRIAAEADPADISADLKRQLDENRKVAAKKETDLINKYADRQNHLKLEAMEIVDNNVDDSAPSSDDDIQAIEIDNNVNISKNNKTISTSTEAQVIEMSSKKASFCQVEKQIIPPLSSAKEIEGIIEPVELELIKQNGNDKDHVIKLDDAEIKAFESEKEMSNPIESDSEQIKLVLSDEDSNQEVKSIESDGQNLLQKRSEVNVSTLESSDSHSETHESSDGPLESTKFSDVVSIENSSSDVDNTKPSTPSKEKQSLLQIDDSDEGSGNQAKSSNGNTTENENDAVSCENVLIDSTEEESHACDEENKRVECVSVQKSSDINTEDESNSSDNLSNTNTLTLKIADQVDCVAENTKPDDTYKTNTADLTLSADSEKFVTERETCITSEIIDELNLDTENSISQPMSVDDNENNSSSENQNSDIPMDIGPTVIQGTLSVDDNENDSSGENQNSDVAMDIAPTAFQRILSVEDDKNTDSGENENSNFSLDIGPTTIQGTLSVVGQEYKSENNQNIDCLLDNGSSIVDDVLPMESESISHCATDEVSDDTETSEAQSEEETAPDTCEVTSNNAEDSLGENKNSDVAMYIEPTAIQGLSVESDENSDNGENENSDSGENENSNFSLDIGPTTIQGKLSIGDQEYKSGNNHNADGSLDNRASIVDDILSIESEAMSHCATDEGSTSSHSVDDKTQSETKTAPDTRETTLNNAEDSSGENKNSDVGVFIEPTAIQRTLSVEDDENMDHSENKNLDSGENENSDSGENENSDPGENQNSDSGENENSDSGENENSDLSLNIGPATIQETRSVCDQEYKSGNNHNTDGLLDNRSSIVDAMSHCATDEGSTSSHSVDDKTQSETKTAPDTRETTFNNAEDSSGENKNSDVGVFIEPTEIQRTLSVEDDENMDHSENENLDSGENENSDSGENQNSDSSENENSDSGENENSDSGENENSDLSLNIGPATIQETRSVCDQEYKSGNNHNTDGLLDNRSSIVDAMSHCATDEGSTSSHSVDDKTQSETKTAPDTRETTFNNAEDSSGENKNSDVGVFIEPTAIQRTLSVEDDENMDHSENKNLDSGENENSDSGENENSDPGDNQNSDSGENENSDSGENENSDLSLNIGPATIQETQSVCDQEYKSGNNHNTDGLLDNRSSIVDAMSHCATNEGSTSSHSVDEKTQSVAATAPATHEVNSNNAESIETSDSTAMIGPSSRQGNNYPTLSKTDRIPEIKETVCLDNHGKSLSSNTVTLTSTDSVDRLDSIGMPANTVSQRTMDYVTSAVDSIIPDVIEPSLSGSMVPTPTLELNVALVGD